MASFPCPKRAVFIALLTICSSLVKGNLLESVRLDWGDQHSVFQGNGDDAKLTLDQISGSGIQSKESFLFGSVEMLIKLVPGNSAGTVTAYFLHSGGHEHDEIDFEFLGNVSGQPYIIHTNLYTQGAGGREQQFHPWFDPTADYHNYTIHWSPSQVVWYVDGIPIRAYNNYLGEGIPYPYKKAMQAYSSIWNADSWATRGGLDKIDWTKAPFVARLRNFRLTPYQYNRRDLINKGTNASTPGLWLNTLNHNHLNRVEHLKMNAVRNKYMVYSYCGDFERYHGLMPGECLKPQY